MDKKNVLNIIDRFKNKNVGVIGDLIIDEYIFGSSSRVSREAPVLILKFNNKKIVPGGGGNSAANLAALGANVSFFGYVDKDREAEELLNILEKDGISTNTIIRTDDYLTPVKTRILAGGSHTTKQQVIRIDKEKKIKISGKLESAFYKNIEKSFDRLDALIVSDYGLGTITRGLMKKLLNLNSRYKKILAVDSRYDLVTYRDITLATPNEWELREIFGKSIRTQKEVIKYGLKLKEKIRAEHLIVTQGSSGMTVFDEEIHKIPTVGSDEVADVTGCGDTVIAAATLALTCGISLLTAGKIANHAGGIAVTKRGTAPVSLTELRKSVQLFWE